MEQTTLEEDDFRSAKRALDERLAAGRLPSCALDEQGVREQQRRHARLAPDVTAVERREEAIVFSFAEQFDRAALDEMVAVEQSCCPFFTFAFDEGRRALTVGVKEKEMLAALDAIAAALAPV